MKIERDGAKLTVRMNTDIGWHLAFTHTCSSEGDAAAWAHLLQQHQDRRDMQFSEELSFMRRNREHLLRSRRALRGRITRILRGHA